MRRVIANLKIRVDGYRANRDLGDYFRVADDPQKQNLTQ